MGDAGDYIFENESAAETDSPGHPEYKINFK
jgi:hypothetical protein